MCEPRAGRGSRVCGLCSAHKQNNVATTGFSSVPLGKAGAQATLTEFQGRPSLSAILPQVRDPLSSLARLHTAQT